MKMLPMIFVACGGCVFGAGAAVGYGTKKGFYAGGAVHTGVMPAQATLEIGGTRGGQLTQLRFDVEANKLRFLNLRTYVDTAYPGARAGIGYSWTNGERGVAAVLGPDVGVKRRENCTADGDGAPNIYVGVEWRYAGGESQFVLAPRFELVQDLCWH